MRRLFSLLVAVSLMTPLVALAPRQESASAKAEKVIVCHKPGTPAERTLEIPAPAVDGHLGHGDLLGACSDLPVIDSCEPNPCDLPNQTGCVVSAGTAYCLCDEGNVFDENGDCVVDDGFAITPCDPNPCTDVYIHRSICIVTDGLPQCLCDPGFVPILGGDCVLVPGVSSCPG